MRKRERIIITCVFVNEYNRTEKVTKCHRSASIQGICVQFGSVHNNVLNFQIVWIERNNSVIRRVMLLLLDNSSRTTQSPDSCPRQRLSKTLGTCVKCSLMERASILPNFYLAFVEVWKRSSLGVGTYSMTSVKE